MFDATLLDSSPERTPVLTLHHWVAAFCVGVVGSLAGYRVLPLISAPAPKALVVESVLLGVGVMFYELMLWYVLADARHLGLKTGRWSIALLLLNVVGFVAYLIYSAAKTGEWKRATLPLAYLFQGIVVCALLLFPLISTQALPDQHWILDSFMPPPPAGPPPAVAGRVRTAEHPTTLSVTEEPAFIPARIVIIKETPDDSAIAPSNFPFIPGGVGDGKGTSGVPFSLFSNTRGIPPPAVITKPATTPPTRVGGNVEGAKLIFRPNPVYPPLAVATRTQGTVQLEAIISKEGTILELKALSGHPLLIQAAMDAVARWRYQPTLLNGEPIEVVTEIEVNFKLNE